MTRAGFPADIGQYGSTAPKGAHHHRVGRYPGWRRALQSLPRRLFKAPSGCVMESESKDSAADRCGGSAGWAVAVTGTASAFLLPVELRPVNHAASTNGADSTRFDLQPYNCGHGLFAPH